MHFAPKRAAQAAEAPSSTIPQVSVHRQHLQCSISEPLHTRDSHMAMVSKGRSMPCLRLPASKSFKRDQSGSDASTTGKPGSPASMVSSRRSVSSMKHLLPLRLQPTPPQTRVDLTSWLDNTVLNLQTPTKFNFGNELREELNEPSPIPWITSSQDVQLSHNPLLDRYMETPVYPDRGSRMLSRAYSSDEDSCYHCLSKGSICDELCIVSDYEDAETPSSYSQDSAIDYIDTFDVDKVGSVETFRTSFALPRMSELSARYHGECCPPHEAVWIKSSSGPWVEAGVHAATSSSGNNHVEQDPFESWLDSESGRSSSSLSDDEVLDVRISDCTVASSS
jgi:hypothetical protein